MLKFCAIMQLFRCQISIKETSLNVSNLHFCLKKSLIRKCRRNHQYIATDFFLKQRWNICRENNRKLIKLLITWRHFAQLSQCVFISTYFQKVTSHNMWRDIDKTALSNYLANFANQFYELSVAVEILGLICHQQLLWQTSKLESFCAV